MPKASNRPGSGFPIYSGCGNTFALVDLEQSTAVIDADWIRHICSAAPVQLDGVLLFHGISPRSWKMRIFNSDGGEAEMCGNGVRCLARYLKDLDPDLHKCTISTLAGDRHVHYLAAGISVNMGSPTEYKWDLKLDTPAGPIQAHYLNTGVPHVVSEVSNLGSVDVNVVGSFLRHHSQFLPHGANANFFERIGLYSIAVRTFERGCERETLACGTGATASALVAAARHRLSGPIEVLLQGGDRLVISFVRNGTTFSDVHMIGPAEAIFPPLPANLATL